MKSNVREVAVSPAITSRSTLPRVDYADAFVVEPGPPPDETPEQWVRAFFAGTPESTRAALRRGWASLGLRVGSPDAEDLVFGWSVRRSERDLALLGAESRVGMPAELLVERRNGTLLFATLVAHRNPLVRLVWAAVAPGHRRVVHRLLERARR